VGLFCVGVCAIVRRRLKKTIEGNKRVWFALRRDEEDVWAILGF
jgi:hypothetical protein